MLSVAAVHETEMVVVVFPVRVRPVGAVGAVVSTTAQAFVLAVVVAGADRLPAASYASTEID